MRWRVLVAPTCYKEGLAADQVATAIARGVRRAAPDAEVRLLPLTDGGEGFARMLAAATDGSIHPAQVRSPLGSEVAAHYAMLGRQRMPTAALEIAAAAGLRLIPRDRRDPLVGTSYGVGQLIRAALDGGAQRIIIGCGDSGTCDGGFGMAHALGIRFLDARGVELALRADALCDLKRIDTSGRDPRLDDVEIEVACNFHGLLVGERSTAKVYGPQKGASHETIEILDRAMERYAEVLARDVGVDVRGMPGAGAAGGLGAGLHALLGARLRWRYDVIFRYIDLDTALHDCDLAVTGEGMLDARTFLGKLPAELGRRTQAAGVPLVAVVGQAGDGAQQAYEEGIHAFTTLVQRCCSVDDAMARADVLIEDATENLIRSLRAGTLTHLRRRTTQAVAARRLAVSQQPSATGGAARSTGPGPAWLRAPRSTARTAPPQPTAPASPFGWVLQAVLPLSLITTAGVTALLSQGLDVRGRLTFFTFAAAAVLWCTTQLNAGFVGLAALVFLVATGAAPQSVLIGALASDVVWLLIGAFVLATALRSSGLADRLAHALLRRAGTVGSAFWMLTTALIPLAYLVPSTSGRAAMFLPVYNSAAAVMRDRRTLRALSLLVPGIVLTSTSASLIAAASHLIVNDLLTQHGSPAFSFASWAAYGAPFGVASSLITCAVISRLMLDPKRRAARFQLPTAEHPRPVSQRELGVLVVCLGMVGLWLTQAHHGLDAAVVTLMGALTLSLPGIGCIDWKDGLRSVSWSLVLFVGSALVLGRALLDSGVAEWLVRELLSASGLRGDTSEWLMVTGIALIALTSHLYIPSHSARAAVLMPPLLVLAAPLHLHAAALAFLVTMGSNYCLTMTVSSKALQLYHETESGGFESADLLRVGAVLLPAHLVLMVAFYFGYWRWTGLAL